MENSTVEELNSQVAMNKRVCGIFVLSHCELKPFKQKAGHFFSCLLNDKTGTIKGIIWDRADSYTWAKDKVVVKIGGELTRYNDVPQVVISGMSQEMLYDSADFVQSLSAEDIEDCEIYLTNIGKTIKEPLCKLVWKKVLSYPGFSKCPGGVGAVHHNYIGGLIEHTAYVVRIADDMLKSRPNDKLDRDLLLTGALVHDLGKIRSYNWNIIIEVNDRGRLLYHTTLGCEILDEMEIEDEELATRLKHIMISHHGDHGPCKPMFPEAIAISTIDSLDASMNHSLAYIANAENQKEGENWTTFCRLTERQYYNPQEKKELQEPENPFVEPESPDSIV